MSIARMLQPFCRSCTHRRRPEQLIAAQLKDQYLASSCGPSTAAHDAAGRCLGPRLRAGDRRRVLGTAADSEQREGVMHTVIVPERCCQRTSVDADN
jgi:hypothetical protein